MSALRQSDLDRYYSSPPQDKDLRYRDRARVKPAAPQVRKVVKNRNFPQQNKLPQNLKLLSALQKTSFGLALVSMLASTSLYISTVQIPRVWSQEYRHLEDLQRQERQLIAINEKIKYHIARQAGRDKSLSISQPESAIFVTPAKANSQVRVETPRYNREVAKIKHHHLGY